MYLPQPSESPACRNDLINHARYIRSLGFELFRRPYDKPAERAEGEAASGIAEAPKML